MYLTFTYLKSPSKTDILFYTVNFIKVKGTIASLASGKALQIYQKFGMDINQTKNGDIHM